MFLKKYLSLIMVLTSFGLYAGSLLDSIKNNTSYDYQEGRDFKEGEAVYGKDDTFVGGYAFSDNDEEAVIIVGYHDKGNNKD